MESGRKTDYYLSIQLQRIDDKSVALQWFCTDRIETNRTWVMTNNPCFTFCLHSPFGAHFVHKKLRLDHKFLSLMACVQMFVQVRWGLGSGCPLFPPGLLFYRETVPLSPFLGPLARKWGRQLSDLPPPPSRPPTFPTSPPASRHHPSLLCVLTVLTIKPWP